MKSRWMGDDRLYVYVYRVWNIKYCVCGVKLLSFIKGFKVWCLMVLVLNYRVEESFFNFFLLVSFVICLF